MPRVYTSIGKRSGDLSSPLWHCSRLLHCCSRSLQSYYLDVGRPVLFRQRRPGLNGTPFTLMKFRTMRDAHDSTGNLLAQTPIA